MNLSNSFLLLLPCTVFGWSLSSIVSSNLGIFPTKEVLTARFASFDFSSTSEWDTYYQEEGEEAIEWHSSISLETVASLIPPGSRCLVPGCGNSKLPQVILSQVPDCRVALLDSSQTCIDQLREEYGSSISDYFCGDATKLSQYYPAQDGEEKFDIIIDKGLSDAILCGEGWNDPLKRLFEEAATVLKEDTGLYVLISYKLPKSTQEFIREVGKDVGFEWQFELPDSNNRVSVSIAQRRSQ
eukprot:scaffold991_cov128-Cylindrotheca_fusiformis.AAC.12